MSCRREEKEPKKQKEERDGQRKRNALCNMNHDEYA